MRATGIDSPDANGNRVVRVWLDERQKVAKDDPRLEADDFTAQAGDPDPDWVIEHTWGPAPDTTALQEGEDPASYEPSYMPEADYEEMIRREVKLLAEQALAERRAPVEPEVTPLAEGEKL